MIFSGVKIEKLLGIPDIPNPGQFYLVETDALTQFYLSDSKAQLHLLNVVVSDDAYGSDWDGVTDEAPSKNAIYDKIESAVLAIPSDARPVIAKTANYGVLASESNTVFTNEGTATDLTFTLPASAGCTTGKTRFTFLNRSGGIYQLSIKVNGTDHLICEISGSPYDITGGGVFGDNYNSGCFITVLYVGAGIWMTEAISAIWG